MILFRPILLQGELPLCGLFPSWNVVLLHSAIITLYHTGNCYIPVLFHFYEPLEVEANLLILVLRARWDSVKVC